MRSAETTQVPDVVVGDRGSGKTEALLKWLLEGERTDVYPSWSRVVITTTRPMAMGLHKRLRAMGAEDPAHRVYHFEDWRTARVGRPRPLVAVDDFDMLAWRLMGVPDTPVVVSLTGRAQRTGAPTTPMADDLVHLNRELELHQVETLAELEQRLLDSVPPWLDPRNVSADPERIRTWCEAALDLIKGKP